MANISVRKLNEQVYNQLRIRAAQHGVSMEEEARQIISQVVSVPARMSDVFREYFGPNHGIDLASVAREKRSVTREFNHIPLKPFQLPSLPILYQAPRLK